MTNLTSLLSMPIPNAIVATITYKLIHWILQNWLVFQINIIFLVGIPVLILGILIIYLYTVVNP